MNPLIPTEKWNWFCLDNVRYHNHNVSIFWDKDGSRYHLGKGFRIFVDGREAGHAATLKKSGLCGCIEIIFIKIRMIRTLISLLLFLSASLAIRAIEVTGLTSEMLASPMALVTKNPHLGWQLKSTQQGSMQSACKIEIKGRNYAYTSSKIISSKSQQFP